MGADQINMTVNVVGTKISTMSNLVITDFTTEDTLVISDTNDTVTGDMITTVKEVDDDVLLIAGGGGQTITLEGIGGGDTAIDDLLDLEQRGYNIEFM